MKGITMVFMILALLFIVPWVIDSILLVSIINPILFGVIICAVTIVICVKIIFGKEKSK